MPWSNQPLRLFHGTTGVHADSVLRGIDSKKFVTARDFGPGFYTTTNLEQAWEWANDKADREHATAKVTIAEAAVVEFAIERDDLALLEALWFALPNSDYWDLVRSCRSPRSVTPLHQRKAGRPYDVVIGPVASRWFREPYAAHTDLDQISFHTTAAFRLLDGKGTIMLKSDVET